MGAIFLYVTSKILLAIRGGPYMDPYCSWCGPCQMMVPGFDKATAQLEPHVQLAKVNTEQQ